VVDKETLLHYNNQIELSFLTEIASKAKAKASKQACR
jgi:hypothetical protein